MKTYARLFSIALAGLALGACSSDDAVSEQGGPSWNSDGTGYVNLSVKLPTVPAGRGVNDNFDDGEASEYAVNDATLILFSGASEADATVQGAYSLNLNFKGEGTSTDAITTTANITQQINSITAGGNIYALVVLNNNGLLTVGDNAALTVSGASANGKTLAQLNDAVNNAIGTDCSWHNDGYLMSNAVLTSAVGGPGYTAGEAQTLAGIDASKIYPTRTEAAANPAAVIYVERAEAKVTVSNTSTGTVTDGTDFTYTVDGWTLDQTNKTSKLVRTIDGYATWAGYATAVTGVDNPYRFVGNVTVGKDIKGTQLYRVYWGDDYNYTSTAASGLSTVGTVPASLLALDKNGYCFENTVNLNGMTEQNLTRVIVKATFNEGQPFFVIDGNTAKMFAEADVKKEIAARVLAADKVWFESNLNNATINSETDFTVTLSPLTAGKVTVASVALTEEAKNKFKENTDFDGRAATWLTAANKTELAYYANGAAYYPVYVKHFGDELTPWADQAATSADIYPGGEQNYLGRYGMLRNNWYKINVQSIKSIGSPTVETGTGTIDKKESYISVTVNTLPWAVRTQNADL